MGFRKVLVADGKPANWEKGLVCGIVYVIGSHTKNTSDGWCLLVITEKQTNKTSKEGTLRES